MADVDYDPVQMQALVQEVGLAVAGLQATAASLARRLTLLNVDQIPFPWTRDIRALMPTNKKCPGLLASGWWQRRVEAIKTVCFHHTLSASPVDFARWYVTKEGGRPSTCYTIWVSETGEILLCGNLEDGCWHNYTGHENLDLSVGFAGNRAILPPSDLQLDAAARVAAWAIKSPMLPLITSTSQILGHQDYPGNRAGERYATDCPGWLVAQSGKWKSALYARISSLLAL